MYVLRYLLCCYTSSSPIGFHFTLLRFFLWHAVSHSYNVMVSFAVFVFVRHTAHCFLLLVSCMLYVVKKHCPEETHLNRWAKRRLIMKNRQKIKFICWKDELESRYDQNAIPKFSLPFTLSR